MQQTHAASLPEDSGKLFAALLAMTQEALVNLLAVCVAPTIDVVTPRATKDDPGAELAQAVGLDMAAWWKPTAEGYFRHVPKAAILDTARTFAPSDVRRLATLKKDDLATEAERLAAVANWMPAVFGQSGAQDDSAGHFDPDAAVDDDTDGNEMNGAGGAADAEADANAADDLPHVPMAA